MAAMLAVGLWAFQLGGRAVWRVPATFVAVMALGGAAGVAGVRLPGVEAGVLASVLVLGLLVATAKRLPLPLGLSLVGLFAFFHGHAHGAEMPVTASAPGFATGFVLATAGLHVIGVGLAWLVSRCVNESGVRFAGAAVVVAGVAVWLN